jgi:lipopolysaccharide export system protein LptC
MSRLRVLLLLLIVGAILALVLSFRQEPTSSDLTKAEALDLSGYNDEGALVWHVHAKSGELKEDRGHLSDVVVRFFADEKEPLEAWAPTLVFRKGAATLEGGVEATRGEGYRLTTEQIAWNEAERTLTAHRVEIATDGGTIAANEFRYDLASERSVLSRGIDARIDRSTPITVSGDQASEENGLLQIIDGVTILNGEETYLCSRLEYDTESDTVRLIDSVEGTFQEGEIHADEITLTQDGIEAVGAVVLDLHDLFFGGNDGA